MKFIRPSFSEGFFCFKACKFKRLKSTKTACYMYMLVVEYCNKSNK